MAGSCVPQDLRSESSYLAVVNADCEDATMIMHMVDDGLLTVQMDNTSRGDLSVQIPDPDAASDQTPSMDDDFQTPTSDSFHTAIMDSSDDDSDGDLYGSVYTGPSAEANENASLYLNPWAVNIEIDSVSMQGKDTYFVKAYTLIYADTSGPAVSATNGNITMPPLPPDLDLSYSIKGMYRILDLISEQGSGGLVDKIIVAQGSLQAFINTVSPGAYVSLAKVDFKALDRLIVKPVGIYGSKEEIVRFLSSVKAVNHSVAQKLLALEDGSAVSRPTLQSGLYIIRSAMHPGLVEQLYVIYWPEDSTWNDAAVASVQQNRVMFMRYLMKICDQVIALISSDHARSIVWNEESATVRPGFQTNSQNIAVTEPPADSSIDPTLFTPRLLFGETVQGFMTANRVSGSRESLDEPSFIFVINLLNITIQEHHNLQLDPTFIPSPQCRVSYTFRLPTGHSIAHAQLLEDEKLLLVVVDSAGNLLIYLERLSAIDNAIERGQNKIFHRGEIGQSFILAYDESKCMLAVCAPTKLQLHVFVFGDGRGSMQALGSAINLVPWFNDETTICQACFISGSEQLLLVDSSAQARIFSLVTMQLRPAALHLHQIPTSIYSSPDGSCLLVSHAQGSRSSITAYHWGSFGSTEGISLDTPDLSVDDKLVLTSLVNRTSVHLVKLDFAARSCQSFALDITCKATEPMFEERGSRASSSGDTSLTAHNCLIDCHAEVWTRFPVLPAVQRETISSSSKCIQKTLTFITDRNHHLFSPHFTEMIHTFERTTRKPTGDLKSIMVSAVPFAVPATELSDDSDWSVSQFRGGEWLVDLLCLIPIHIAIMKENRFVPLKDGVSSPKLERLLLGAEVSQIVDSLSFGWYESLFQSYMASKPVKVVSSMGEQSAGKSYALNHLVDTSFASSAMRTEGVWMSVTPTKVALIVSLDFEGVHSIERSAQEDTFLVLFGAAISNLVLFRNNFVLGRDITCLFQPFQSGSTILDPRANPMLFQSTLIIIIKDVADSDRTEIAREFARKIQEIILEEQEVNFITRLHAGRLNIIPWPVIESKEFYKLFPALKKRLDQQVVTHNAAGKFLYVMKTLMAKLKVNDWGAISETMATRRAQLLLSILPNALTFGLSEVLPEHEPLMNLLSASARDTASQFSLAIGAQQSQIRESALATLREAWDQFYSRQMLPDADWTNALSLHLENLANMRIDHVREWVTLNLSSFQSARVSIEELQRTLENAIVDLKASVRLCRLQCADCHLLCVQSRLHEGQHHCQTSHQCIHVCGFCDEPLEERMLCRMPAGHPGAHICVTAAHLCGELCMHTGTRGCLDECSKAIGHTDEDHLCAASVHVCGEPCALSNVELANGETYSCTGTCCMPRDVYHPQHQCDARLCDISCQLCERLCSNEDHVHGLDAGAVHLCGQGHICTALCSAPGICEIDTVPLEATFTGRRETFQYTKYSQVAERLKCIKPIPSGALTHEGAHNHSMNECVHSCETRCENCDYFCTLPLGHPQQEHETRHGSMSRTRWAINDADDTSLEVEGHKFSFNDEGTPTMCHLVCQAMGRHVHIDYCRADDLAACTGNDIQHISERMIPNPDRHKDAITHSLFWRRNGFKDPYSRDEQANFAKCDVMCAGPEHTAAGGGPGQPSYCTLPLFHAPRNASSTPEFGYVSNDGHMFSCRNPVVTMA